MARAAGQKLIADNRRARHDYHLSDRLEVGIELTGTEVKSLRDGRVVLQGAFGDIRDGQAYLVGAHIGEYAQGNAANHDPDRDRRLLLHRREIDRARRRHARAGRDADPDPALLQGRSRQARARGRAGQGDARQASRPRRARRQATDGTGAQGSSLSGTRRASRCARGALPSSARNAATNQRMRSP